MKKQNRVPLSELNLTDRFLFDEVMEDPQTHQDVLSIIFGKEIPLLRQNETEKELRVNPSSRSIRMDVFANQSYIIMIMTFDLFGYGHYQYTFYSSCKEEPECMLNDGAIRIFLNTHGTNDQEVSSELVDFLHYLENTTDEVAALTGSACIQRIHERVRKIKQSEEVGVKYMQAWEEKYYEREEGKIEGIIGYLLDEGADKQYICEKIMKRFSLSQESALEYIEEYLSNKN